MFSGGARRYTSIVCGFAQLLSKWPGYWSWFPIRPLTWKVSPCLVWRKTMWFSPMSLALPCMKGTCWSFCIPFWSVSDAPNEIFQTYLVDFKLTSMTLTRFYSTFSQRLNLQRPLGCSEVSSRFCVWTFTSRKKRGTWTQWQEVNFANGSHQHHLQLSIEKERSNGRNALRPSRLKCRRRSKDHSQERIFLLARSVGSSRIWEVFRSHTLDRHDNKATHMSMPKFISHPELFPPPVCSCILCPLPLSIGSNNQCLDGSVIGMLPRRLQYLSGLSLRPLARSLQFSFSGHSVPSYNIWDHQEHHCSFGRFRFFSIKRDVTYLLVDADRAGKDLIDEAKTFLGEQNLENLEVLVFGNPQLCKAKRWSGFFNAPGHQFHAVERVGGLNDPNDDAIKQEAERLVKLPQTKRLALLTSDRDFVDLVKIVHLFGKEMLVFLSKDRSGSRKAFEEAGAKVFLVGAEPAVNKVRAILNSDGSGSTELAEDASDPLLLRASMDWVLNTLLHLGYRSDDSHPLLPALAKFWFRHELGPLVVYPLQNAVRSAHMVLSGQRKIKASSDKEDLAFVLPLSAGLRNSKLISKADRQLYGTGRAKAVYHGGGPFMLRRSHCLTMNVLRRLGYLDDCMNSDLNEGLLVFLNSARNKMNLRDVGTMPQMEDSPHEIDRKINQALVSGQSYEWSLAPSDMEVRKSLVAERLLVNAQQPREEVLTAMQEYTRRHGLRAMKSYNGYVWQLKQRHNASDPNRRDQVKPSCLLKWHLRREKVRARDSVQYVFVTRHLSLLKTMRQSVFQLPSLKGDRGMYFLNG